MVGHTMSHNQFKVSTVVLCAFVLVAVLFLNDFLRALGISDQIIGASEQIYYNDGPTQQCRAAKL